jgi:hypothetical protein
MRNAANQKVRIAKADQEIEDQFFLRSNNISTLSIQIKRFSKRSSDHLPSAMAFSCCWCKL